MVMLLTGTFIQIKAQSNEKFEGEITFETYENYSDYILRTGNSIYFNGVHKINYKDTFITVFKILVPALVMTAVLLVLNNFLPFNVYSRTSSVKLIVVDAFIGAFIYIGLSIWMKIPQHIFGTKEINKIIKKLTFGKFQIKES